MKKEALHGAEKYTKAHQRKKRWYRVVTCLACVVVFCTVYALILPAITMEKGACEIPEHTHSEACYTQVTSVTRTEPVCTIESLDLHQHDDTCYDSEGNLTCGYADFVVHQHDSACYDENGNLRCPLKEIEVHEHTDSCYAQAKTAEEEVHTHTDDCYNAEGGELICDLSAKPEEEAEIAEPVLICEKPEVILHTHQPYVSEEDPGCYDEDGNLVCGQIQVLEHQHTDACFETVEEPLDTESLTCTLPEDENHTHGPLCYGTWELTCGMEEHTHSEECMSVGSEDEILTEDATSDMEIQTEDTSSGMEIPAGLPVQGTAYASPGAMMFASLRPMADSAPLDVTVYVTDAVLSYRTDSDSEWIKVGDTPIPGDADLRLDINYEGVNIDTLLAAGGIMTFTLPDLMRNPVVNGVITSGSTEVGTITADGSVVTLQFDQKWLTDQKNETNTTINGDFYIESAIELSMVPDDGQAQLVIGDVTIQVKFEEDIIAQSGEIDITKSTPEFSEEDDGDYLTYTITVTAGHVFTAS